MCLILKIRLSDADARNAPEIRAAAGLQSMAMDGSFFGQFRKRSRNFGIAGPDGGCGCSFLADSADWNSPTWEMSPEALPRLSSILRAIRKGTADVFEFEALWIGQSAAGERSVTIDELVSLVQTCQLGTKTRYFVQCESRPAPFCA
jgi:hypothetical protein